MPNIHELCNGFEKHDFNGMFKLDPYGIDRRSFDYDGELSGETIRLQDTRKRQDTIQMDIFKQLSVYGKSDEQVINALRRLENCERVDSGNPNYNIFDTEFAKRICEERGIPIPDKTPPVSTQESERSKELSKMPKWIVRR
jgi:hypothetical protein